MFRGSAERALIIPAAGAGSRLQTHTPKFLVTVQGRTMLEHLIARYEAFVSRFIVIVGPAFVDAARARAASATSSPVDVLVQERPTGMLDAVLQGHGVIEPSGVQQVWVTWCDQIAIEAPTVERLAALADAHPDAGLVMPMVTRTHPYIHFDRDADARIVAVRQRREGDAMPEVGDGDVGLFSFSRRAYLESLSEYAGWTDIGATTGERNLLPFIPWLAAQQPVITFPCTSEMESIGINTPEELRAVEAYLAAREPS